MLCVGTRRNLVKLIDHTLGILCIFTICIPLCVNAWKKNVFYWLYVCKKKIIKILYLFVVVNFFFLSISASAFEPDFVFPLENVTIAQGRDATFTCVVNNLGGYRVSGESALARVRIIFSVILSFLFCFVKQKKIKVNNVWRTILYIIHLLYYKSTKIIFDALLKM